ncbi:unnamed protein product [Linum trigynum]
MAGGSSITASFQHLGDLRRQRRPQHFHHSDASHYFPGNAHTQSKFNSGSSTLTRLDTFSRPRSLQLLRTSPRRASQRKAAAAATGKNFQGG